MFRALATRSPFINFQQGKPLARAEYNEAEIASSRLPSSLPPFLVHRWIFEIPSRWSIRSQYRSRDITVNFASPAAEIEGKGREKSVGLQAVVCARTVCASAVAACQTAMSDNTKPRSAFRPTAAQSVRTISLRNSRRWTHNRRLPVIHRLKIRL